MAMVRRPFLIGGILACVMLLLLSAHPTTRSFPAAVHSSIWGGETAQHTAAQKAAIKQLRKTCAKPNEYYKSYGRANVRMSRGYEGSLVRLENFVRKALRGEHLVVATIGGSVTKGHNVYDFEGWFFKIAEWFPKAFPSSTFSSMNGAVPATGSDYYSYCFPLHIPHDTDLVFVELGVNDEALIEHYDNMENLLRGLLAMEKQPAVILVEAAAFSTGGMAGGGGRMHLPIAQYFDVPVINQRHPLVHHFTRFPKLVPVYFSRDYWGSPDMRHINARGHNDLFRLCASLIHDVSCDMVSDPHFTIAPVHENIVQEEFIGSTYDQQLEQVFSGNLDAGLAAHEAGWADEMKSWMHQPDPPKEGEEPTGEQPAYWPGMWTRPDEFGMVPRLRALDGWNPNLDKREPIYHPHCMSTRSPDPSYNLTAVAANGWRYWVHPEHLDKAYYVGWKPGDSVTFQLHTATGHIKMYNLMSGEFGLGKASCWVDNHKNSAVTIDAYWDKPGVNIGRFATISENAEPGLRNVTCEILSETSDPKGGTEFRVISIMSL